MPNVAVLGDVVPGEVRFEWNVGDFFSLSDEEHYSYESPVFSFAGAQWYIRMYPNKQTWYSSSGWMGIYLHRRDLGLPQIVYLTFGIKGSNGVEEKRESQWEFSRENKLGYGEPKAWSRSDLKNRKDILLPKNMLTVTCRLRSEARSSVKTAALSFQDASIQADSDGVADPAAPATESQTLTEEGEGKVLKSLRDLLESGEDSDIVMKVQGKEFRAHRVILRARSAVFRSMFHHDMAEKQKNEVTIEDCDPETFQDFLVHLYSGSCKQISPKNVFGLFTIADKYDFGELKAACKDFMEKNLSINGFCDVITFALRHSEQKLVESATEFFCSNSLEIVKTANWQVFLNENLTVGNELIIKAMSK